MELARRTFLHGAGAGLALAVTGAARPGWTATTLNLGSAELTTLSDGYLVQPRNFVLGGMPEAEYMPILRRHGLSPEEFRPECNVTLFRDGDRVVLFDAGSGSGFLPTVGTLPETMGAIGLNPEDVTHVVFTHGHADHLWGVLDDFDEPFFPNAEHMMGRVEFDYWFDPDTVNRIAPTRANMAAGAKRRLDLLAHRITLFDDDEEILPNVAARMTPGHTPGHMSFEIRGGSESVMILGDAVTNHHINFERPEMGSAVDQDRQMGADTRVLLLDQIARAQMGVIGFHLPQGGIGRVERLGDAYRYVPETG